MEHGHLKHKDNYSMKEMVFAATIATLFAFSPQTAAQFTFTPQKNNTVGFYLGGQIWQSEASGIFGEENTLIDFKLNKEQQINYFFAIEHPYPLLPNVRISSTMLDSTGKFTLTQKFNFGDETFLTDAEVDARFNVSYVDYTFYYELFSNGFFSFDLGFTARDFNGAATVSGVTITENTQHEADGWHESCFNEDGELYGDCSPLSTSNSVTPTGKIKTDQIEAMLHVATNISLPLTRLSAFAQGDFSLANDHSLYDYQLGLSYGLADSRKMDVYLTLGYRAVKVEFEDLDNLYTDLEFKGAFIGMITHF